MLCNKSFDEMLEEIGFDKWIEYDILIPEKNPELFREVELKNDLPFKTPTPKYVKSICELIGLDPTAWLNTTLLHEIFLNSFESGNRRQEYLPVSVKVFKGSFGYVLRIRDSGKGFDFGDTISKKRNEEKHEQGGGEGFRTYYENQDCNVAFEGNGSVINLQILN